MKIQVDTKIILEMYYNDSRINIDRNQSTVNYIYNHGFKDAVHEIISNINKGVYSDFTNKNGDSLDNHV